METVGRYPAIAVVSGSVWGSPSVTTVVQLPESVQRASVLHPAHPVRVQRTLVGRLGDEGHGWDVTDTAGAPWGGPAGNRYFADLVAGGKQATDEILSLSSRITGSRLTFLSNEHGARDYFALAGARTGEELRRALALNRMGLFVKNERDVSDLIGSEVRFKAVGAEDGGAYAWIGFDDIVGLP